jgi:chaperonin GroEL
MSTPLSNAVLRRTTKDATSKLLASSGNIMTTRSMASGKEIRFGVEGRAAMLRGVDLMADAVQVR